MHRSALRLRFHHQSNLRWYFYNIQARRLSSAGTVPAVNSDKQFIENLEPWQDTSGKALARREKNAKDITVDDLFGTLEAHRASNRAAVIRKIRLRADHFQGPILRPSLGEGGNGGSEVKQTDEAKQNEHWPMWPADSVQAKRRYGKTGTKGFVKKTDPLEYNGVVQWAKQSWKLRHSSEDLIMEWPWLAYMDTTSEDCLERLTNEIKAYEAYMRLSPEEEAASELVISDVNSVALNEPGIKPLTLLGSRSTGLATPSSDFDFTFTLPTLPKSLPGGWTVPPSEADVSHAQSSDTDNKLKAVNALKKMDQHFRASNKFGNIELVRYARVPIIRFKHIATGLDVQIQTSALYQAAQEHTVVYLSEFPSLRPLYIILRYCLEIRDLTTVFEGGLGSYSIFMMIVTVMKHSSGKFASDDLGGQLLHVLEFYGKADLYKVGFSANPPRVFEKQGGGSSLEERTARRADSQSSGIDQIQKFYPRKPYLLCLQDPANDQNDLGKNAYAIKHIQATFNTAKESIQALLRAPIKELDVQAKGGIWSCLDSVVRADYRPFEMRRNRVERCSSSGKLDDRDYSKEGMREGFEKRVTRYRGVAEEGDNLPGPALEAIDGNAAESVEAQERLKDGAGPARYREGLSRTRSRRARVRRVRSRESAIAADNHAGLSCSRSRRVRVRRVRSRESAIAADNRAGLSRTRSRRVRVRCVRLRESAIAAERKANLHKLHGTNDDEYGWTPSTPDDQKTLLEAIAAPKAALAARNSASVADRAPDMPTSGRTRMFRKHTTADKGENEWIQNLRKKLQSSKPSTAVVRRV